MSSPLKQNTITIQELLNTINSLPEASSGGEQTTPVISINQSNGLITATAGTKSSTHQLAFQAAKTITPSTASQIAVSSGYYTGGNVTVAGDSNLVAGNIKSGVSIFGVNGNYVGSGGGDTSIEDSLITRNIISYDNDRVTSIGNYVFYGYSELTTISFPNVTTIGDYAFRECSSLTSVNFPKCTTINQYAFYSCRSLALVSLPVCTTIGVSAFQYCYSLTSVNFPKCTTIGSNAFLYCTSLTSVNLPVCTTIRMGAFCSCSSLTSVSFPECTSIGWGAFQYCTSLTSVNFPKCTNIDTSTFKNCTSLTSVNFPVCTNISSSAFQNCTSLTSVSFPECTSIGDSAFNSCTSLTSASFPKCTTIYSSAFMKCYNLVSLYLTGSLVCTLLSTKTFSSTPIGGYSASAGRYGSIYVPASLLTSYKTATNWTYFSSRFVGI